MFVRDTIVNGLLEGFLIVANALKPHITKIILGGVLISIVKYFINKFVYSFSVISGDNRRETKRKLKNTNNAIDLISNFKEIFPKKK